MRIPSNRICDIERFAYAELEGIYPHEEIRGFLRLLFEEYLGWDLTTWLLSKQKTINQSDLLKINFAIKDLKRHRPIQHIIGKADFCCMTLRVDENVLIPRPETEGLVELAKDRCPSPKRILDLCTGSGCIAIALAKAFPEASITAMDISEKALEVARQNAWNQGVEIKFMQADVLNDSLAQLPEYDLIVSNPPYVRELEKSKMQPNVLDYEPHLALFVPDNDPLLFYRRLAEIADKHLVTSGLLVVEINESLGEETAKLFHAHGFETTLHNDFKGRTRFAVGRR
ncbi:MAG: peptide chain release factor N(5)-glutamine methyltransferase [Bacteroidales bacterium]|nr:peptide chain release factor N(5)-glutamine methyltransferase [Bacteroidales bacterium]